MVGTVLERPAHAAPGRPPVAGDGGGRRQRLTGLDVARGVAVVGMLVVNAGAEGLSGPWRHVWAVAHGRASLLFVLLAGVGVAILADSRGPRLTRTLLWRGGVLLGLGVALSTLEHGAEVILPTYALLFLVALSAVRLPTRGLVGAAAVLAVVGPLTFIAVQGATGLPYDRKAVTPGADPLEVVERLLVTGPYPLVTWTVPFLVGLAVGRLDLHDGVVRRRLAVGGTVVAAGAVATSFALVALLGQPGAVPGPDHLVVTTAHSQMPLWLLGGTAAGVAVLAVCLLVADRARPLLRPLEATGRTALTLYAAHLVVLAAVPERPPLHTPLGDVHLALVLPLGAVVAATLWSAVVPVGPLEALLRGRAGLAALRRRHPRAAR